MHGWKDKDLYCKFFDCTLESRLFSALKPDNLSTAKPHCYWEAALLPGFLCFILDTIKENYDRDPLSIYLK